MNGHLSGENSNLKRYMYPSVHHSTIYNSQDRETTCHTVEYYSVITKNKYYPLQRQGWDPEIITVSEVRQRKTSIIGYHLQVDSKKKNDTSGLFTKWLPKGNGAHRDKLGAWSQQIQTTIYKINTKVLLYSIIKHSGKNMKTNIYICVTESLYCKSETNTTL